HGRDDTDRLPRMAEAFASLPATPAILNGEFCLIDRPFLQAPARNAQAFARRNAAMFIAFDMLHQDGVDLRSLTLTATATSNRFCRASPSWANSKHSPIAWFCSTTLSPW